MAAAAGVERHSKATVVVLGAGPAGCAVALGLMRLGIAVRVLSQPRTDTIEGISPRTLDLLRTSGFAEAARECAVATPRVAHWAGKRITGSSESLVSRLRLDAALCRDLVAAGIDILQTTVRNVYQKPGGFRVVTDIGELCTRFVIDARGRRARRADELGPRLIAWSELHRPLRALPAGSGLVALERGWCWIASTGERADGRLLVQYIGKAHGSPRSSTATLLAVAAEYLPELAPTLTGTEFLSAVTGRAAVARFSLPAQMPGLLRVGDAGVAMDPLSGHGIFEALRSAQAAIAATNSYLTGMDWGTIARFVNERASEVWRRSLVTAAQFYRREAVHAADPFWTATADGYSACAALAGPKHSGPGRIETRPVLNGSRIELRDIWVSAKYPRGIWQVNGQDWRQGPVKGVNKQC
jgi:flavin-dependent dehydrogenase